MAAAFAVVMVIVLVFAGTLIYSRVASHLAAALDLQLQVRAQDLAVLVESPGASVGKTGSVRFFEQGESYSQLIDANGRVLEASPTLEGVASLLSEEHLRHALAGPMFMDQGPLPSLDEQSRILATPVKLGGETLVLLVGQTREERAEILRNLRNVLLLAGPLALVLASLSGYALAAVALRPVDAMRRRAAAISAETPGERLPVPSTGDEIERLGETLNEMLERLESALERERTFVADAGHELRTPLALLRAELELALRHGTSGEELRETLRASVGEVDRLTQLAEDLLLIARFDEGRLPLRTEGSEPSELLGSVASRFEWRAQAAGRAVTVEEASGFAVWGDRLRLEQALGNLVDNALRYGQGEVRLSAEPSGGVVELHVTDEGDGFPHEFLAVAFERFTRPDQSRKGRGAGLGLSIVRVIAEAHGGSAHVGFTESGGADVWLRIPANAELRSVPAESPVGSYS